MKGPAKSAASDILMKYTKDNEAKTLILLKKFLLNLGIRASFWTRERNGRTA